MPGPNRTAETIRRDLRRVTLDGGAFSLMVGLGESYLPAFALALGLGDVFAGLVAALPMVAGATLGLLSTRLVARLGSHRRFVVLCALGQACAFAPLALGAWQGWMPAWAVFASAALYWTGGLATGPAWNTWMGTVVPRPTRARYFGRRVRVVQLSVLFGLISGGAWLGQGSDATAFVLPFALAGAARLLSARLLATTSEPEPLPPGFRHVPLRELLVRLRRQRDGRFLSYLVVTQLGVHVAGPFFAPFFLSELDLSAWTFAALTATSYLTKVAVGPAMGELARRFGAGRLLVFGGVGIVPLPALYLLSSELPMLFAWQVWSGAAWAAHELATTLLVFETVKPHERTGILALFNLGNALAMAVGALLGAALLATVGAGPEGYLALFVASTVGRALSLFGLRGATRLDVDVVPHEVSTRVLALRPGGGSVERPVLPALEEQVDPAPAGAPSSAP